MNRRLSLAIILAATLGRAAVVYACGVGGSSGGSSSGGSSGGSSSGGSSSGSDGTTATPSCYDASDVHGYQTCRSYGSGWAIPEHLPAISVELQTWSARIDLSGVSVGGTIHHSTGADYNYRVVGQDVGQTAMATGLSARILVHRGHFYAGLEGGGAAVFADEVDQMATGDEMTTLTPHVNSLITVGAVIGLQHPMGRLSLGAELMAGVHAVGVAAESHRGACETRESHMSASGTVEGRLRADVWLTPWITVGAYAGRDAIGGQASAGLGLGGHLRAFDGSR